MDRRISIHAWVDRDSDGFWVAHIEKFDADIPFGANPVTVRYTLPLPSSATHEQAEQAFYDLVQKELQRYGCI